MTWIFDQTSSHLVHRIFNNQKKDKIFRISRVVSQRIHSNHIELSVFQRESNKSFRLWTLASCLVLVWSTLFEAISVLVSLWKHSVVAVNLFCHTSDKNTPISVVIVVADPIFLCCFSPKNVSFLENCFGDCLFLKTDSTYVNIHSLQHKFVCVCMLANWNRKTVRPNVEYLIE